MKNFNEILIFLASGFLLFLFFGKKILEGNSVRHDDLKPGVQRLKPWDPKPGAAYDPNQFCNKYNNKAAACVSILEKYKCIWKYDTKKNNTPYGKCNYTP